MASFYGIISTHIDIYAWTMYEISQSVVLVKMRAYVWIVYIHICNTNIWISYENERKKGMPKKLKFSSKSNSKNKVVTLRKKEEAWKRKDREKDTDKNYYTLLCAISVLLLYSYKTNGVLQHQKIIKYQLHNNNNIRNKKKIKWKHTLKYLIFY